MTDSPSATAAAETNPSNLTNVVPLPSTVIRDDAFAPDNLRSKLSPKRSFFHLSPRKPKRRYPLNDHERGLLQQTLIEPETLPDEEETLDMPFVQLGDTIMYSIALEEDYSKDVYKWAVLYENQRGITMFSTPYYSYLSLLPIDPPPFTVPSTSKSMRHSQPTVSLDSYTLPNGTWRWVSRSWMVDMRGEGQTQYDGFEYNWFFQRKHWRAEIGSLSTGGWVRRRRWVRLMMRPALSTTLPEGSSVAPTPHMLFQNIMHVEHHEAGMTRPPSVVTAESSEKGEDDMETMTVWQGESQLDWERCRAVLKQVGTDGRQLELWQHWLDIPSLDKRKQLRWTEDEGRFSSEVEDDLRTDRSGTVMENIHIIPDKRYVAQVLRNHVGEILNLFIYPDSRAQFLEIVGLCGLLPDLDAGLGLASPNQVLDFYSSSQSFHDLLATSS